MSGCWVQAPLVGAPGLDEDGFETRWRSAIERLEAVRNAADHRCFHTNDALPPDAMRHAHQIALAAPPLSVEQMENVRPLFTLSPQQLAERDRLLTPAEAARTTGLDEPTVLALIEAGDLIAESGPEREWMVPNWAIRAYRTSTNKTFCIDCRGSVDGKLESRWLASGPARRSRPVRRSRPAGAHPA